MNKLFDIPSFSINMKNLHWKMCKNVPKYIKNKNMPNKGGMGLFGAADSARSPVRREVFSERKLFGAAFWGKMRVCEVIK